MKLPYRVLVLEDDENALAGIVELLTESGYDVTPASAYEDAKGCWRSPPTICSSPTCGCAATTACTWW